MKGHARRPSSTLLRFIPRKLLHKPTVFTVLTDQAGNAIQTLLSSPWQKWFAHSAASGMEVSLRARRRRTCRNSFFRARRRRFPYPPAAPRVCPSNSASSVRLRDIGPNFCLLECLQRVVAVVTLVAYCLHRTFRMDSLAHPFLLHVRLCMPGVSVRVSPS